SILVVVVGLLTFIFQLRSCLPPESPGTQATTEKYLFGTLETANGSIFSTLGLSYAGVAKKEHDAGVAVAQVTIAWEDYEISDGAFDENLMTSITNKINIF